MKERLVEEIELELAKPSRANVWKLFDKFIDRTHEPVTIFGQKYNASELLESISFEDYCKEAEKYFYSIGLYRLHEKYYWRDELEKILHLKKDEVPVDYYGKANSLELND